MNMWNSIKYGFDVSNDGLCLWSSRSKGGMALVLGITKIIYVMDCECDDSVDKTQCLVWVYQGMNPHWKFGKHERSVRVPESSLR